MPQDYKAAPRSGTSAPRRRALRRRNIGSAASTRAATASTKDLDTAKLWYERAAEAGNRMSMHNLAALYAGGQLGKQQFDSAAKWFEEAANRGLTDSQFNLGMLYARGLGVPQSLEDSFKWFGIAALSGDKDAAKARDDIARSLDAETRRPAHRRGERLQAGADRPRGELRADRHLVARPSIRARRSPRTTSSPACRRRSASSATTSARPTASPARRPPTPSRPSKQATGMSEVGLINPRLLAVLGSQPV